MVPLVLREHDNILSEARVEKKLLCKSIVELEIIKPKNI
jgi:hypothetical protein